MSVEQIRQIRLRIMSEAYDLADRGDSEGYNAVKVMCSDVLALIKALETQRLAQPLELREISMTKIEAWKAWCETANTADLATEFNLQQSSHGKAFSFAWDAAQELFKNSKPVSDDDAAAARP